MGWAGSPWLRRGVLLVFAATAAGLGYAYRASLPSATWLRDRDDRQLAARTLPPRWTNATRWTIEVEADAPRLRGRERVRATFDYRVMLLEGERALLDVSGEQGGVLGGSRQSRFVWDATHLQVVSLPARGHLPSEDLPTTLEARLWRDADAEAEPQVACWSPLPPWAAPFVARAANDDLLEVLGEHRIGRVHQRAWVEDGIVRFAIRSGDDDQPTMLIAWRPGDPWWAKLECAVAGKTTNPPARERWEVPRAARARLVAVDGVAIEPMLWEHAPADWMDPSGR